MTQICTGMWNGIGDVIRITILSRVFSQQNLNFESIGIFTLPYSIAQWQYVVQLKVIMNWFDWARFCK